MTWFPKLLIPYKFPTAHNTETMFFGLNVDSTSLGWMPQLENDEKCWYFFYFTREVRFSRQAPPFLLYTL